jgi:hypothetical protein
MNFHKKFKLTNSLPIIGRRSFLKTSLIGGVSFLSLPLIGNCSMDKRGRNGYRLSLDSPTRLFDGKTCWTHPRAGIIPGAGNNGLPQVVMTMNTLDLAGSDVFKGMYGMETTDFGETWTLPKKLVSLAPRHEIIDGTKRPVAVSDFWPCWHKASKTLLGTGHTVVYTPDWKVINPRPRHTSYSAYNIKTGDWGKWQKLEMPDDDKFYNSGAGCVQRFDMEDGTILLPFSFRPKGKNFRTTVCKCSFDGEKLKYLEQGSELELNDETRGLGEPSLAYFNNNYFLTMRNDKKGFVARSTDGLHFDKYVTWKFDDGTELGSYNTQQHWVAHSNGLFLVYTRRGAGNDHVFRHRAPLFMAKVDPESLCVIRDTEQILVPERGARLGNFGVTNVGLNETWVTVSEWMQPHGVEKYGSDGSIFVARIHWNRPNRLFDIK